MAEKPEKEQEVPQQQQQDEKEVRRITLNNPIFLKKERDIEATIVATTKGSFVTTFYEYDDPAYKMQRIRGERLHARVDLGHTQHEYKRCRNRYFCSFAAIDTINTIELIQKWAKDNDKDEVPGDVIAKLALEQKLINWTNKYVVKGIEEKDHVIYLLNKTMGNI